jgi:hypothetical protein
VLSGVVVVVVAALVVTDRRSGNEYAQFGQCPLGDPATSLCLSTESTGGKLNVGAKTVPIGPSLSLQGGVDVIENGEREVVRDELIAARDGATLSSSPQAVPGGLAGTVDADLLPAGPRSTLEGLIRSGHANVTATIEPAGPVGAIGLDIQHLVEAEGTALSLPVKVKLSNTFLGADCYIGSDAHPIWLSLTTGRTHPPGPNVSIKGNVGKATLRDEYNLTIIRGSSLVNNSFAAPGVRGCGGAGSGAGSFTVDRAVDAELGLPAAAGRNTAILDGTLRDANALAVRAAG